ncbi:MAG: DUF4255 domain-containing protein [Gemmatimonadaceae bacterium]
MSSGLAIASVTAVLRDLLATGFSQADVAAQLGVPATISALPPDRIQTGLHEPPQLNIFLYRVTPHLAVPRTPSPTGARQLALELHYLVTAYGAEDLHAEILLGQAIRTLHETSIIPRARIEEMLRGLATPAQGHVATPALSALQGSAVGALTDQWQILPDVLPNEDMMHLWTALQGKFRPSVTYKVVGPAIEIERRATT